MGISRVFDTSSLQPFWVGQQIAPNTIDQSFKVWDKMSVKSIARDPSINAGKLVTSGAAVQVPGIVAVAFRMRNNYKRCKSQNQDVATLTDIGRDPHELDVIVKLTGNDEWNQWQEFVHGFNLTASGKNRGPLLVTHPQAQVYGIDAVTIASFSAPAPNASDVYLVQMRMTEWAIPVPVKTSPVAQRGAFFPGGTPPPPTNPSTVPIK